MSPRKRNGTKTTIIITAVLHFQKGTRAVTNGKRTMKARYFFNVAGTNFCTTTIGRAFGYFLQMAGKVKFFSRTQHQVHTFYLGDFFGLELRIAAGNNHHGLGSTLLYAAHDHAALFVCIFCHRAGVYHINVCIFLKILFHKTFRFERTG